MTQRPRTLTTLSKHSSVGFLTISSMAIALSGAACDGEKEDNAELRAILDDGELTSTAMFAQSVRGGTNGKTGGTLGSVDAGNAGGNVSTDSGAGGFAGGTGGAGGFAGGTGGIPNTGGKGGFGPDGGVGGGAGGPGCGFDGTPCFSGPIGSWDFDDCNEFRTQLLDNSFNGNTAFRSVRTSCTTGASGQSVTLPNPSDIVYVPDQPTFTFGQGVTVAAWINPRKLGGVQTLFRKRDGGTSSLAFVLNGKQLQFVVDRQSGSPVSVEWKGLKEGIWTHVAARYDGTHLALFVNGSRVVNKRAVGAITDGEGPILMGNDIFKRRFDGGLDDAWFAVSAAPDDVIMGLTCLRSAPTLVATPSNSGPVPAGTPFTFDFAVTNNNSASCLPSSFVLFSNSFFPDITINPGFVFETFASGVTVHIPVAVSAQEEAEAGVRQLSFQAQSNDRESSFSANAEVTFVVAEPSGCHVKTSRELMIKNISVVDDPLRTTFNEPGDSRTGKWTFKHLMEEMAPTAADAPDMVEAMFQTWLTPQEINGFVVQERPAMQELVLNNWPRTADGKLDLARAPLQLQAIVNRFDLRNLDENNAGEGRFVFAVLDPNGFFPMQFTLILEYKLPATTLNDVNAWANDWHALGAMSFPSEEYNAALTALTERFVGRGVAPGRPNGSAINSVRTNEIALSFIWELREFRLDPGTGRLRASPIELTPDIGFNFGTVLGSFINANQTSIFAETHSVPLSFNGAPFSGGAVVNDLGTWFAPDVDPQARHKFALNTCNGCHSSTETNTGFLHIAPRFPGSEAGLSGFLTGTTVFDPVDGTPRTFNDLARRKADLTNIVCPVTPAAASVNRSAKNERLSLERSEQLRHGIKRVH